MKRMIYFLAKLTTVAAIAFQSASAALAQDDFPNRPIRLIVPFAAGASSDVAARRVGEAMSRTLGKPIVVENVSGAGGIAGIQRFRQQPADGYTLLAGSISTHAINVGMHKSLPYDPIKDFAPISRISSFPNILVVHPSLGVKNLQELVGLLKKQTSKDGNLSFASGGKGSTSHLGGEQLKQVTGADLTHVPDSSVSVAMPDFLAGRTQIMFGNMTVVQPFIEKGNVVAIANTAEQRAALLPNVPTVREQGFEAMGLFVWIGLFAPAGTPPAVVKKLHAAAWTAVNSPEVRESFKPLGTTPEADASPEGFAKFVDLEIRKWVNVTKSAGIASE